MAYEGRDEHPPEDPVGSVADERGGLYEDFERVQKRGAKNKKVID